MGRRVGVPIPGDDSCPEKPPIRINLPEGEPELSYQWRLGSMQLENREYTEEDLARAIEPADTDDKWPTKEPNDRNECVTGEPPAVGRRSPLREAGTPQNAAR